MGRDRFFQRLRQQKANPGRHGRPWHGGREASQEERKIDEFLEELWMMREEGLDDLAEWCRRSEVHGNGTLIDQVIQRGWVEVKGGKVAFTPAGEERARGIIRRHRLAERLLADLLELEDGHVESAACQFEHILSVEVTDSVCTLLGHPPTCPHGRPIPRGECCARFQREVKPLVMPLSKAEVGQNVRIVFIAPGSHARLDRLSALGITPGSILRVHQKLPAYVIQVGEADLALDEKIAEEIYVKNIEE